MSITQVLIHWYRSNKRSLPWRNTNDPYRIWLSEIIMQQTRIDQGLAYFQRFIEKFPTLTDLAQAEEQEVLRLWQGLGYYTRARNLHASAKQILNEYEGVFPSDYALILKLRGVGEYTAAAISSFAFGQAYAVVDGNVYRFLARYFSIETAIDSREGQVLFKELANDFIDKNSPALFNQAIMEFGSLQCKPQNPNCTICPFQSSCRAFAENKITLLPVKKEKQKVKNRYIFYIVAQDFKGNILMKKRNEKNIWQNLYDFPLIETEQIVSENEIIEKLFHPPFFNSNDFILDEFSAESIHLLSHQKLHLRFIKIHFTSFENEFYRAYTKAEIEQLPLPRPIEHYLSRNSTQ